MKNRVDVNKLESQLRKATKDLQMKVQERQQKTKQFVGQTNSRYSHKSKASEIYDFVRSQKLANVK